MAKKVDTKVLKEYIERTEEMMELTDKITRGYEEELKRKDEIISTYKQIVDIDEQSIELYEQFVKRLKASEASTE